MHPASTPKWLADTLASRRLGGIDPALVHAAAADPGHAQAIGAVLHPGREQEAFNLCYLLYALDSQDPRPEYLALARRMHQVDPEHHGRTLAWIAGNRPLDMCESEILRIAFDPRGPETSRGWEFSREAAASSLVQRLAFDAPTLPRPLPPGAPPLVVADNDRQVVCYQRTLLAGYAQGEPSAASKAVEECLARDDQRPGNDHDAENCRTVIYRLQQGR